MPALTQKKFLDSSGVMRLVRWIIANYPDSSDLQNIVDAIQDALDEKADTEDLGDLAYANTATGSYTPAGTVSAPDITVVPDTTTMNSITNVGSLPTWSASVDELTETLSFSFNQGALPTKGPDTTVATGIRSAAATQPAFTGTAATISVGVSGS